MGPRDLEPITIGMPQMVPYGLSENWLLRHLGDVHWQIICDGLGRRSRDMIDVDGNRLYASFVRVCWTSTVPLSSYKESDTLTGSMAMVRFGDGVFISSARLAGSEGGAISAKMASVFTRREGATNDRLVASAPALFDACPIPAVDFAPAFVEQHRLLKAVRLSEHSFMNTTFDTTSPTDEEIEYETTGYYDFNGASLLYFASYPTIAEICASRSRFVAEQFGFERFVKRSAPIGRDIFYFGNANPGDRISCGFALQHIDFSSLAVRVELTRAATGALIGRQFLVRARP